MVTQIKICGLTQEIEIPAVNAVLPEYVGFVFAPNSKRFVTHEQAAKLRELIYPEIACVGVFVDADIDEIISLYKAKTISIIQLHGNENEMYLSELQSRLYAPIIKVVSVTLNWTAPATEADYLLLDSGTGGTGEVFDWGLVGDVGMEYFLAGGLTPDNVGAAVEQLRPYCVDVSSGVETNGLKDAEKIRLFCENARQAAADRSHDS